MKRKRTMGLVVLCLFVLSACATTPHGKAQQSAQVVVALGQTILKGCRQSKDRAYSQAGTLESAGLVAEAQTLRTNWMKPLTKENCAKLTAGYDIAWDAAKRAMELTKADPNAITPMSILTEITNFVLNAYDILTQAGVVVPEPVTGFVQKTQGALLE